MAERASLLRRWLPAGLWALVIFILCSLPLPTGAARIPSSDKAAHFGLFAVLSFLLSRSLFRTYARKKAFLVAVALSLSYGLFIELYQILLPGRFFEYLDLLADGVGGVSGALLWAGVKRRS
jgi:VanZ family protein